MKALLRLMLCALLLAVLGPVALCAQSAVLLKERDEPAAARPAAKLPPAAKPGKAPKAAQAKKSPQAKKAAKAKARAVKNAQTEARKLGLTRDELLKPYSPGAIFGPPAPPPHALQQAQDNATRTEYDPAPKSGPFAEPEKSSPINLRFGRDEVVDPLEKKDVVTTPDAAAAAERAKKLDLKGALNKVGGKAEVQVDILKF